MFHLPLTGVASCTLLTSHQHTCVDAGVVLCGQLWFPSYSKTTNGKKKKEKNTTARPKKDLSGLMWGDRAKGKHEGASGI